MYTNDGSGLHEYNDGFMNMTLFRAGLKILREALMHLRGTIYFVLMILHEDIKLGYRFHH